MGVFSSKSEDGVARVFESFECAEYARGDTLHKEMDWVTCGIWKWK